jgi:Flp pilus assembly protein TadG
MICLRSILRDQRGNSFIEMAFAAPLLATLLIGTVDISRAVAAKVDVEQAAQRTLEKVQAQADFKTDDIDALVTEAEATAGDGSSATVDAWLECNNDGNHLDYDTGSCAATDSYARYVQVDVTGSYTPMFGTRFFPGARADGTVAVDGKGVVRVQ